MCVKRRERKNPEKTDTYSKTERFNSNFVLETDVHRDQRNIDDKGEKKVQKKKNEDDQDDGSSSAFTRSQMSTRNNNNQEILSTYAFNTSQAHQKQSPSTKKKSSTPASSHPLLLSTLDFITPFPSGPSPTSNCSTSHLVHLPPRLFDRIIFHHFACLRLSSLTLDPQAGKGRRES